MRTQRTWRMLRAVSLRGVCAVATRAALPSSQVGESFHGPGSCCIGAPLAVQRRWQSSHSRFTRTAGSREATASSTVNSQSAAADATAQTTSTCPASSINSVRPITTVAELQSLLRTIRVEMRSTGPPSGAGTPGVTVESRQHAENRRRHLHRQLLSFSPSALSAPQEASRFTIAVLLQVVQALELFSTETAWDETALVAELSDCLVRDMEAQLRATPATADAANGPRQLLLSRYVACVHGLLNVCGARTERMERSVVLLAGPIRECLDAASVGGRVGDSAAPGARPALDNATLDTYLVCVLTCMARCLWSSDRGAGASLVPRMGAALHSLDSSLLPIAEDLRGHLLRRLESTEAGASAGGPAATAYVNLSTLASVVSAWSDAAAGVRYACLPTAAEGARRVLQSTDDSAAPDEGTGYALIAAGARAAVKERLTGEAWRSLATASLQRLSSDAVFSEEARLVDAVGLLRSAAVVAAMQAGPTPAVPLVETFLELIHRRLVRWREVGCVPPTMDLALLIAALVDGQTTLAVTTVLPAAPEILSRMDEHLHHHLLAALHGVGGEAGAGGGTAYTVPVSELALLVEAFLPVLTGRSVVTGAHLPRLLTEGCGLVVKAVCARIEALPPPGESRTEDNPVAEWSPRAVYVVAGLGAHLRGASHGQDLVSAAHRLRTAYYAHLKLEFNRRRKVFPADVACLYSPALLGTAASGEPGSDAKEAEALGRDLAHAVRANVARWSVAEVFVFLHSLAAFSAGLGAYASLEDRTGRLHKQVNAILRECVGVLAPYAASRTLESSDGAVFAELGGSHTSETEEVSVGGSGGGSGGANQKGVEAAAGFEFTDEEVLTVLQTCASCGVRNDAFLTNASKRFTSLFQRASEATEARGRARSSRQPAGAAPLVVDMPGIPGRVPLADLDNAADVLSSFAVLEFRDQSVFLAAAPVVVAGLARASSSPSVPSETSPSATFGGVSSDAVTRLLAAYAAMLVWNYDVVAAGTDAVKAMCKAAPAGRSAFTLEQMAIVQQSLIRLNAMDTALSNTYIDAVEAALASSAPASATMEPGDGEHTPGQHTVPLQRAVGLLSVTSRVGYAFREDARERAGQLGETRVGTIDGEGGEGGGFVVDTFERFSYVPLPDPLQQRVRGVCSALADAVLDGLRVDTVAVDAENGVHSPSAPPAQGTAPLSLSSDLVAELLLSLARVHLFDHALFALLRQESLSAVLRPASALCFSQMTRAIALSAVVSGASSREASSGAQSTSAFYDEYFSLAASEALRMVKEGTISAAMLSHVLFSFTIAGQRNDKVFITVLPKMRLLAMYGSFEEISEVFYSYTKNNIWHQKLFAKLADRIVDLMRRENVLHKQQLLLILESLASVRYVYDRLFDVAAVRMLTVLHLCSFEDVARLVHCYVTLNYRASTEASAPSPSPQSPGKGQSGASPDGSVYDALYTSCCDRVVDVLRQERQHGRQDFLQRDALFHERLSSFLSDLSEAGVHDVPQLLVEVAAVAPAVAERFTHLGYRTPEQG